VTGDVVVEAAGETVGEAKWAALRELERRQPGLDKTAVRFEVLTEGERGLLGVGYAPARVVAMVAEVAADREPPAASGAESDLATDVRSLLEEITRALDVECRVEVHEDEAGIRVDCLGTDMGSLIGRYGQTIDAVQYLANAVVRRAGGERHVTVDAAGYRERRAVTLQALAQRSAERATATGHRVELDPMTAVERKIVHEYLKEDPEVETTSEGTEPNRFVVILPHRSVD